MSFNRSVNASIYEPSAKQKKKSFAWSGRSIGQFGRTVVRNVFRHKCGSNREMCSVRKETTIVAAHVLRVTMETLLCVWYEYECSESDRMKTIAEWKRADRLLCVNVSQWAIIFIGVPSWNCVYAEEFGAREQIVKYGFGYACGRQRQWQMQMRERQSKCDCVSVCMCA